MKRSLLWLIGAVAVIMFIYYLSHMNRHFDWISTDIRWEHESDEPLGLKVFDSIAVLTARNGYKYDTAPFNEIEKNKKPISLLFIDDYLYTNDSLFDRLWQFIKKGNDVMIIASRLPYYSKKIDADINNVFYPSTDSIFYAFKNGLRGKVEPTERLSTAKDSIYSSNYYFINSYVEIFSDKWKPLATAYFRYNKYELYSSEYEPDSLESISDEPPIPIGNQAVAAVRNVGKGKLYLVANPYLFTNYGALDPVISKYQSSLLSLIDDKPVIRLSDIYEIEDYIPQTTASPFRFFLEHEPLRWALYTTFVVLLLFMAFMARRRQRIIPYIEQKKNRTVEFVKLMGNIYYKQHDINDLFKKKYTYFCEEIRRRQLIDLGDRNRENDLLSLLAGTTGLPVEEVSRIMHDIWTYADGEDVPNDKTLRRLIDEMNGLLMRCRTSGKY